MQDGRMVLTSHKFLVLGMKNGPMEELWAHLRWYEARSVIWGHPMFTISWWTWSFLTIFRLTWLQMGKKIRKEHFLQFGQSTPSGFFLSLFSLQKIPYYWPLEYGDCPTAHSFDLCINFFFSLFCLALLLARKVHLLFTPAVVEKQDTSASSTILHAGHRAATFHHASYGGAERSSRAVCDAGGKGWRRQMSGSCSLKLLLQLKVRVGVVLSVMQDARMENTEYKCQEAAP